MGQYFMAVNLDKKEFINPHTLGAGLKLWEILANEPGVGSALVVLCAAHREVRGGGDFDLDENWHGPERTAEHNVTPGPMPEEYQAVAHRTIGRWAGDRIALVGDYAERSDLPDEFEAEKIYGYTNGDEPEWTDVSDDVAKVIEHELNGHYEGDGWRNWVNKPAGQGKEAQAPDLT